MSDRDNPNRRILAVVYTDALAADLFLARVGYRLRDANVKVAGLVQSNTFARERTKCDMQIEELASGTVLQLSEQRGAGARGCRLDRGVLADAAALLLAALTEQPEVLILNKFGKIEAEGGGLRDVVAVAVEAGIPLIVGVPFRNLDQWRAFAGEFADECPVDLDRVADWLASRGIARPQAEEAARRPAADQRA